MTSRYSITIALGLVIGGALGLYARLQSPAAWTLCLVTGIVAAILAVGLVDLVRRLIGGRPGPDD